PARPGALSHAENHHRSRSRGTEHPRCRPVGARTRCGEGPVLARPDRTARHALLRRARLARRASAVVGISVSARTVVPTVAGPSRPSGDSRVEPAIGVMTAVPRLNAATLSADPSEAAVPENRTARWMSTPFALRPNTPRSVIAEIIAQAWLENRRITAISAVETAGVMIVTACGQVSPSRSEERRVGRGCGARWGRDA